MTTRYAIFYTPPRSSALAQFGKRWLGYDIEAGVPCSQMAPAAALGQSITAEPRRYGFHATLKAPFALAEGADEAGLLDAIDRYAAMQRGVVSAPMVVGKLGAFLALVPCEPAQRLTMLAADIVRHFDPFRAPLTEAERERRRPEALTEAQRAHLERWGYPYVFEEYRFHMTLTGALDRETRDRVAETLRGMVAAFAGEPLVVDALSLVRQPDPDSRFVVIRRVDLQADPSG
ncbi:MAG: DUF1045 domain-containing protein [Alphaproteobacteria bacterium]|jgi:putative phosphonate metabolism protein|nr:DUF1045 domain-containing protein [Alphaproteobacteria bacterium]